MLELAVARAQRAGKSASLVAEQLAFDQRLRKGGTIDGDKGPVGSGADIVKCARHHFLARTGIADNERIGIRRTDGANAVAQIDHDLGSAGQTRFEIVMLARHRLQAAVFQYQCPPVVGSFYDAGEILRGEGLFDEVISTVAHGIDGKLHIAMARHQDDRYFRVKLPHLLQQRHAIHAGHPDIADHDAIEAVADEFKRMFGACQHGHRKTGKFQRLRGGKAQLLLVINQQNPRHGHSAAASTR